MEEDKLLEFEYGVDTYRMKPENVIGIVQNKEIDEITQIILNTGITYWISDTPKNRKVLSNHLSINL